MRTIELLKEKILYKRIKEMTKDKLILEDGTEVYFECTDWDCWAFASGEWKTAELDAVITDVKMVDYNQSGLDGFDYLVNTAKIVLYHNQNSVAQANLYADAGNGGYYHSVLSVFVNEENIGDILSA